MYQNDNHTNGRAPTPQQQGAPRKLRRPPQSTAAEQSRQTTAQGTPTNASRVPAHQTPRHKTAAQAPQASVRPPAAKVPGAAARSAPPTAPSRKRTTVQSKASSAPVRKPAKESTRKRAAAKKAEEKRLAQQKRAARKANEQRVAKQLAEKQAQKSAKAQEKNHAPLYNQEEGIPPQPPQSTRKQRRKGRKQAKPLSKATIRRRNRIRAVVAGLLVFVLVTVGIAYSVNLLFRVNTIEIQTPEGEVPADTGVYTEDVILAHLGISLDDHFFSFSTAEQEAILQEALPLLENIQVLRDYPDTVLVRVEPAVATYTMEIASGWVVLSEQLHVMETVTEQPDLLMLVGATPSTYVTGQSLAFVQTLEDAWYAQVGETDHLQALITAETQARSDAQIETLTTILTALEGTGMMGDITAIDFNGSDGISFLYQDRITVLIGTTNSLDYKLQLVQYILQNENGDGCGSTDTGLLDVSYQSADGTITTVFAVGAVEFPLDDATSDTVTAVSPEEDDTEDGLDDAVEDDTTDSGEDNAMDESDTDPAA